MLQILHDRLLKLEQDIELIGSSHDCLSSLKKDEDSFWNVVLLRIWLSEW